VQPEFKKIISRGWMPGRTIQRFSGEIVIVPISRFCRFHFQTWRKEGRKVYTGAVPFRNSRGPYYTQYRIVCYGYPHPLTISLPEYPVKHLPS
jgi:hypothetical protein